MTWIDDTCDALERYFVANADPERAEPMASYMRDQFAFYGIGAKDRSDILKTVWAEHALPTEAAELADFVDACLARPQREWHYTAVAAMRKQGRHLRGDSWDTVRTIATTHAWWDTIDELAKHIAGRIVKYDRYPGEGDTEVLELCGLHGYAEGGGTIWSNGVIKYPHLAADQWDVRVSTDDLPIGPAVRQAIQESAVSTLAWLICGR